MNASSEEILSFLKQRGLKLISEMATGEGLKFQLQVKAKPNCRKEGQQISPQGELVLMTRARPVDGQANDALLQRLSEIFGIPARDILLQRGERGRSKLFALAINFRHNKDATYFLQHLQRELA